MSSLKTQMALKALDSLENFAKEAIIGQAQRESDRELAIAEFLFKNEYDQHQSNIEEIKRLGLELSPEYQTDNLSFFAENAGDSNYMELLGKLTRNIKDKRQNMDLAVSDYNRGINQAKILRAEKAFASPKEEGIDLFTASPQEIKDLTPNQLSEEDRLNRNFMLGFHDTDDVIRQANIQQLDTSLKEAKLSYDQLKIKGSVENLGIANEFYGNKLGQAGKIMMDSFTVLEEGLISSNKYDITKLIGLDLLEDNRNTRPTYDKYINTYNNIKSLLQEKYPPSVVANIDNALKTLMSTNSMKGSDNAFIGFGKLARTVSDIYKNIDRLEARAIQNNSEYQNFQVGQIPLEDKQRLMNMDSEYSLAIQEAQAYEELGLHLPEYPVGYLEILSNIRDDELFLDSIENNIYEDVLMNDFDYTSPGMPTSWNVKSINDNEQIDKIFEESLVSGQYADSDLNFNTDIPKDASLETLVNDIDSGLLNVEYDPVNEFTPVDTIQDIQAGTPLENLDDFTSQLLDPDNFSQGSFINKELEDILSQYISEGNKPASRAMKALKAYAEVEQSKNNYLNTGQQVPSFIFDRMQGLSEEISKQINNINALTGSELWYRTYGIKPRSIFYTP